MASLSLLIYTLFLWIYGVKPDTESVAVDPNGYLIYCPCMGRFGNQADHFLGSLAFAKALNRTLVLPPWIEYERGKAGSNQIPFTTYFKEKPLHKFHRVIALEEFMKSVAPVVWPPESRKSFCHAPRNEAGDDCNANDGNPFGPFWDYAAFCHAPRNEAGDDCNAKDGNPFGPFWDYAAFCHAPRNEAGDDCNAKDGNPFGPFWDYAGVDFVGSIFHGFDLTYSNEDAPKWNRNCNTKNVFFMYPPAEYPVLAFPGAPASFPVSSANAPLQKYLRYTSEIKGKADKFINGAFRSRDGGVDPFLAIHLRNDADWPNVCEHADESDGRRHLFASPQCLGDRFEHGLMSHELCAPSEEDVVDQVEAVVKEHGLKYVFSSADRDCMLKPLQQRLGRQVLVIRYYRQDDYHTSIEIMSKAQHFIGNCVSSFTAFVKRARDVKGLPSHFWNFNPKSSGDKSEL